MENEPTHFPLAELTKVGPHAGIDNTPPDSLLPNGRRVAQKLEQARAIWSAKLGKDCKVLISYGYRCAALNKAVGGSQTSAHALFLAADAIPADLTLREAFDALVADPEFMADVDQLIIERGCIHCGLAIPAHNNIPRHELRLDKDVDGVRTYPLFGIWTPQGVQHA